MKKKKSEKQTGMEGYIPRRSALGRLTSATFALAGVSSQVAPVMVRGQGGGGDDEAECGNAGEPCGDGCTTGNGVVKRSKWQKCCEISGKWDCCSYWDWCTPNQLNDDQEACAGGVANTQIWWCGDKVHNYVCTETSCDGAQDDEEADCTASCGNGEACDMSNAP